jgi:hypothetical protein
MRAKDDIKSLFYHKLKISIRRGKNVDALVRIKTCSIGCVRTDVSRGNVSKSADVLQHERGSYKARQMTDRKK